MPFMDLIAYVLRRTVAKVDSDKAMFPDEEFPKRDFSIKVQAYYTKKSEAIGLEYLEAIELMQKKFKVDTGFSHTAQFTKEGGIRLTEGRAFRIVKNEHQKKPVTKFFICGHPN